MSRNTQANTKTVITALLAALITMMTWVPYMGYITYGPIEITTLHIVVIVGGVALGWKNGAVLGGVWGINNLIRATTNPLWVMFTNPLISVVPRILVGLIAGLLFALLHKKIRSRTVCAVITAVLSTLIHTALVLTALYTFGGMIDGYRAFFEMFKTIFTTVLTLNGSIELVAAIVIVPAIDMALQKSRLLNAVE